VHLKGTNSMAASGLNCRNDLVGNERAISILFGMNVVRHLHLTMYSCRAS